jgi:hypothetical protein
MATERRQSRSPAPAQATSRQRGSAALAVGSHGALSTSVLPESKDTRFLDAGIVAGVAAATSLWTATRTTALSQYGWGLFWMGLGGLMAVEGRGSLLKYGGFGLLGANAAYLALRTFEPNLTAALAQPPASGGYVRVGSVMVPVAAPAA